jgi:hypothetical protein
LFACRRRDIFATSANSAPCWSSIKPIETMYRGYRFRSRHAPRHPRVPPPHESRREVATQASAGIWSGQHMSPRIGPDAICRGRGIAGLRDPNKAKARADGEPVAGRNQASHVETLLPITMAGKRRSGARRVSAWEAWQ